VRLCFARILPLAPLMLALWLGGCGTSVQNQTASLGGSTAGSRGSVRALFINNTEYRAVFTFGTYDQTDRLTQPDFEQFGVKDREQTLDGGETSDYISLRCGRVFSIGSPGLLDVLPTDADPDTISEEALAEGVTFYNVSDPDATNPVDVGTAAPLEAQIGVDFNCGALLVIYLEPADVGENAFRIDVNVVPADSTR